MSYSCADLARSVVGGSRQDSRSIIPFFLFACCLSFIRAAVPIILVVWNSLISLNYIHILPMHPCGSTQKDLVRTRGHITKMIEMRSHLQGCALKLQTVKSHEAMASAMKSTTTAMMKMNKAVDAPAINKMMREFEKENMKSEMMQEIMGDMMDDVLEADGDAEEEDKIVNQVLDEIGISFAEEVPDAPMLGTGTQLPTSSGPEKVAEAAGGGPGPAPSANDPALSELEERLNNLKR